MVAGSNLSNTMESRNNTMSLKYLFSAVFRDGSTIDQTQDDVSSLLLGKSAFYDVLQRLDDLDQFYLHGGNGHVVGVSLLNGSFVLNGTPFSVGDEEVTIPEGTRFRLIYFRRVKHNICIGSSDVESTDVEYFLGWHATIDGQNVKRVFGLS